MKLHKILISSAVMGILVVGGAYALTGKSVAEEQSNPALKREESQVVGSKSAIRNWAKRCEKDATYCEVFQRLDIKETKKRLVEVAIGFPKGTKTARFAAVLPLGLSLPDGLVIQIEGQKDLKAEIKTCTDAGCVSFVELPGPYLDAMKKNDKMTLVLRDGAGKRVNIIMSLNGFSASLKDI